MQEKLGVCVLFVLVFSCFLDFLFWLLLLLLLLLLLVVVVVVVVVVAAILPKAAPSLLNGSFVRLR